ncbi:MAG: hypothetical protein KTR35_23180 [Gammaproteobacteria bacterium]|nr:hypothetical protein [Gammaproteobacteria bacterium]
MLNILRPAIALFMCCLLLGCASMMPNPMQDAELFQPTRELVLTRSDTADNKPWIGWINIDYDNTGRANAVVYIRGNDSSVSWELAEETTAGHFDESLSIGAVNDAGLLVGFPQDGMEKANAIWVSGKIAVSVNGHPIPHL